MDVFIDDIFYQDMKAYVHYEEYKQIKLQSNYNFIKWHSINTLEKKYNSEDYHMNHLSSKLQKI